MEIKGGLDKQNVENIMSLTSLQQGILFHYIKNQNSSMYHEQLSLTIKGDINLNLFQQTWQNLIKSNEMLRTIFRWEGIDNPVQIVLKEHKVPIEYVDLSNEQSKDRSIELIKFKDLSNRIDITKETIRIYLCKLEHHTYELIISNHHILYDGWSNAILLKELMQTYNNLYEAKEEIKISKTKFSEFIKYLNSIDKDREKNYWSNYLDNLELNDYCFGNRTTIGTYKEVSYKIDNKKSNKILSYAKEKKISLASILYCAYGILLQKFSGSNEVLFGTTVSGRNESVKLIDEMVGLFINTIPLRVKIDSNTKFIDLIQKIEETLKERKEYENSTLVNMKEYCGFNSDELFNTLVTIENYPTYLTSNNQNILKIENVSIIEKTNYHLNLQILIFDGIEFKFSFNNVETEVSVISKLGIYLERIMDYLLTDPNIDVMKMDLLTDDEKSNILYGFNNTDVDYPRDKTIQELFELQVNESQDNIAVIFEEEKLTYRELNEKANSLARILRKKGVKADSIVGIMIERSLEMVIGIMGILKAGGAYLPIDPKYPKERIEYILKDSGSNILLTRADLLEIINYDGELIDLYEDDIFIRDCSNLDKVNNSSNLAYVIYTSGTTGNPKGVMIEHKALINRLVWMQNKYPLSERDTILQKTTYTFDVSVWELLWWSITGAKVCMLTPEYEKDPIKLIDAIDKYNITTMHFVPSMLDIFLYCLEEGKKDSRLSSLRQVFSSGEALNFKQVDRFFNIFGNEKNLINLYGPTEAAIDVSYFNCDYNQRTKIIPIGKPIENIKLYILKDNQVVPVGALGELYIAGVGLARGYLNKHELTEQKFVDNPFELGTKMYKTGDLVKWLPDGNIDFIGRVDNQVKIRGFRIELGEIENSLLEHDKIEEVTVVVRTNEDNEKYIVAYVISSEDINNLNLRSYLKDKIPSYMVPAYIMQLSEMALNSNGKVNTRLLPPPMINININEYIEPENEIEEKLVKLWAEVLGVDNIGVNDNFFDLGGHSLKATMLISKIHKVLNKDIPLETLFKFPTIKELSSIIQITKDKSYTEIKKVDKKEYYEVSSVQKRMYMLQQLNKDDITYNMTVLYRVEGNINSERIEEIFKKIVARHEMLRTQFLIFNDEIVQKVDDFYQFKLLKIKCDDDIDEIVKTLVKPFVLDKLPLFRVTLIENKDTNYLLVDMHHIISDAISIKLLIKEFEEIYKKRELNSLNIQYKDFVEWQKRLLQSSQIKNQEEYWLNLFNDEIPVLNLPYDSARPTKQSFDGDVLHIEINDQIVKNLKSFARETETTMHMILLSVLNILISKWSGQDDIVIGIPVSSRSHEGLQNIMGMFVNTLALRCKPSGSKKYIDFLNEVKVNSIKAYENQDYPFENLVENLNIQRDVSRNPLFDVMFLVDNITNSSKIELDDITLYNYNFNKKISKFDLTFTIVEDEKLSLNIEYCTKLFNKYSIERISEYYIKIIEEILGNKEIELCKIEVLTEKEYNVLFKFNNTATVYPKDKTIHQLFEEQVERTPNNVAVEMDGTCITYKALNKKANQLAEFLLSMKTNEEEIIPIILDCSTETIIACLAVLKAGCAYLPIDSTYPTERVEYLLQDSGARIIITNHALLNKYTFNGSVICIDNDEVYIGDGLNLNLTLNSDYLAYCIYTSGTTGSPKGVMVGHRGVVNYIYWAAKMYVGNKTTTFPLFTSISFDLTVTSIYVPLITGNSIIVYKNDNDFGIEKIMKDNKVDIVKLTPSHFKLIRDIETKNSNVKKFILGGENLETLLAKQIYDKFGSDVEIYNEYGPTEATVGCMIQTYDINGDYGKSVPIGVPIDNCQIYLLDKYKKLVPLGCIGEIYIAGDGLAKGYLNNLKETSDKFIDNPFDKGTKMYKTGDMAKRLLDGTIEYIGRVGNQVKINGFRVDLTEIEAQLFKLQGIKDTVVVNRKDNNGEDNLCAYCVIDSLENNDEKDYIYVVDNYSEGIRIKNELSKKLPYYTVPNQIVILNKMPLTINGKIDKKSMPIPQIIINDYTPARTDNENIMIEVWSEILNISVSAISVNKNFFELGGSSIKVSYLKSKVNEKFGVDIPIIAIFEYPTIHTLCNYISDMQKNDDIKVKTDTNDIKQKENKLHLRKKRIGG